MSLDNFVEITVVNRFYPAYLLRSSYFPRNVPFRSPLIQINDLNVSSPPLCKFESCLAGRLIDPVYPVSNSVNYLLAFPLFQTFIAASL